MGLLVDLWTHSWSLLPPPFQAAYIRSPASFMVLAAVLVLALVGFVVCLGWREESVRKKHVHAPRPLGQRPAAGFVTGLTPRYVAALVKAVLLSPPGMDRGAGL